MMRGAVMVFQFTLPRGERLDARRQLRHWHVSIHAPAWGATNTGTQARQACMFQFTLPRGERPGGRGGRGRGSRFQFTLPRGERHYLIAPPPEEPSVSIHAPAWGATNRLAAPDSPPPVSIHAPAWGATPTSKPSSKSKSSFNSRSRVGSDTTAICEAVVDRAFQFTLPRGERQQRRPRANRFWPCFNSRSRVGSDLIKRGSNS